jgi:hypothetical protein
VREMPHHGSLEASRYGSILVIGLNTDVYVVCHR